MGTAVDSQGAALNECLVARCVVAGIGAFVGVNSIVALEIGLSIKTLWDAIAISLRWCGREATEVERPAQDGLLTFGHP